MIATEMAPPCDVTISDGEFDPGTDPGSWVGRESVGGGADAADGVVVPAWVAPAGVASMVGTGAVEEVDDVGDEVDVVDDVADVDDAAAVVVVSVRGWSVVVVTTSAVVCGNDSIVDPLLGSLVVTRRRRCGWS